MSAGWAGIALLAMSASAWASEVPVGEEAGYRDLFGQVEILEDPSRALTIEEAQRGRFAPARDRYVGYTHSAYFVRVTISNPAAEAAVFYLEPYRRIDHVELYRARPRGGFEHTSTGRLISIFERPVLASRLLLPIKLAPGERTTLYLRLQTINSLRLNLALLSQPWLTRLLMTDWILMGLFYGAVLALVLYNLSMFVSVGDSSYLYYTVFQLGLLFAVATNEDLAHSLFWPHSPRWRIWSESFFFGVFALGAIGFVRSFLGLAHLSPRLDRWARAMQLGLFALGMAFPLATTVAYQKLGLLSIAVFSIALEVVGIYAWRRRSPQAGFFLAGWSGLCLMAALGALFPLGLSRVSWLYWSGSKLGAVVEALVLSLGLASRVNRMRREKARIQAALIASQNAQAALLEMKVAERTAELNQAMETLQRTQERMMRQARLASLGHLVGGVAHEIGNPLNFTQGGAREVEKRLELIGQALCGTPPALGPAQAALDDARRAAKLVTTGNDRIRRIVEHLRGHASAVPAALEPTDLIAHLEETLSMMATQLDGQGVHVVRDWQPIPPVSFRAGELGQVFMNLILNSCQAMPKGGELRLEAREVAGQVELRFSDTGCGIAPEHRAAIFDPFFTTHGPSEGTGLGLSISYEIVRRHGGELELVDSARGASFLIRIPRFSSA